MHRSAIVLVAALWFALGCTTPPPAHPSGNHEPVGVLYETALRHEMQHPLDARAYLAVIEHALLQHEDPASFAAVLASLDALVWRNVDGLGGVDNAIVFRSHAALEETTKRLRNAYASGLGTPVMRGRIADALHDLALRVGAEKAAGKWRDRAGCVRRAALVGPMAVPALTALDAPSPIGAQDPMPAELPGVAPFANVAIVDTVIADSCILPIDETSPLPGLRLLVVDIDNPRDQDIYAAVSGQNASVLYIGGSPVVSRSFSTGGEWTTRFGKVHAPRGRLRIVLKVAYRQDGSGVALQLWDDRGDPLSTITPRSGERANANASNPQPIGVGEALAQTHLAAAVGGWLATGEARRAMATLEGTDNRKHEIAILRVRALQSARHLPRNQRRLEVAAASGAAVSSCADCWEGRLYDASSEADRKGFGTGIYAAFKKLNVTDTASTWATELGPMELTYVALQAASAGLEDVSRVAYDTLATKTAGSLMLADLDARLHRRHGNALLQAACNGGTSRAATRCLSAYIQRSDLRGTLAEMNRLRSLRGSRAILRNLEISQLLAHGKVDDAIRIYDAMPPANRTLGLLGVYVGTPQVNEGKRRFARDMVLSGSAPNAYEPLVRLLGVFDDPAFELEKAGAALVAQDRSSTFLPGAGTAVLKRLEHYELQPSGLLHYWVYDLRRVSGTIDVASGTWMGLPRVVGRSTNRSLRRRIYKKDGRVLDPDPNARGSQGNTDLSQLQAGDYVEALVVGWALPGDDGQLTVDTPDLLPPRTSIREARVTFRRPSSVPLSLWSHAILGTGVTEKGAQTLTTWKLDNRAPRRLERGVPPMQARAAISFGTDSYKRIASALAAHFKSLDDADPFVKKWALEAVGQETDDEKRVARVVAAAGKALERSDPGALADWATTVTSGSHDESARTMIERGVGSRTWVIHRALTEIGVTNDIVVSESRSYAASPGFPPHTGRFTHPLIRANLGGRTLWIDADVDGPPLPPGRVSPELRGRQALTTQGTLVAVVVENNADVDRIAIDLTLDRKGNADGTCEIVLYGRPAQRLVEAFEVVVGSARQQLLRRIVLSWMPWADVKEVALTSDENAWEVRVKAKVGVVGFARPEQRGRPVFSLPGMTPVHNLGGAATTLGALYAKQAERQTALAINTPLLYRVERRITLPPNAKIIALPAALDVKRPYIIASRDGRKEAGILIERFGVNLPAGAITPEQFDGFVKTVRDVDDGFMHTTRIELP